MSDKKMVAMSRAIEALMEIDLSKIGRFPLWLEPNGKEDIYQSCEGKFNYNDYCGGTGHNCAPVFNYKNLVVTDCPCAETVKDALNAIYDYQYAMGLCDVKGRRVIEL